VTELVASPESGHELSISDLQDEPERTSDEGAVAGSSVRPRGFTRAIREFHRLISELQAHDLTAADRAALRSLFRDLLLLARAPSTRRAPVFPPLPSVPGAVRGDSPRPRKARGLTLTKARAIRQ
jgi:hypothetical protein